MQRVDMDNYSYIAVYKLNENPLFGSKLAENCFNINTI